MKIFTLVSILLTMSLSVFASEEKEIWECKDPYGERNNILVTAIANKNTGKGVIKVAGIEHTTKFEIAGFDRQWQFGEKSAAGDFKYVFRVKPNGIAHYFNIPTIKEGEAVESEMILMCRIKGSGWSINLPHNYQKQKSSVETEQTTLPCLPGFFIMNIDE